MLNSLKERIRQSGWLYRPIRMWRSRQQEQEYLALRNEYYQRMPRVSNQPPPLLRTAPPVRRAADLRVYVIVSRDWEHRTLTPVLERDMDVVVFNYGDYMKRSGSSETWRAELQHDVLDCFEKAHAEKPFDLVFAYGSYRHFDPATLQKMRAGGVPVSLMWLDDKHTYLSDPKSTHPHGQKPLIGSVDVHLSNSIETLRWYRAEGAASFYFPEGCNPELGSTWDEPKKYEVTFVGKNYGARSWFIQELQKNGVPIECFGPGWKNGALSDDDMLRVFKQSWINLGFGGVAFSDQITCLKGRDFDVPASGSAYLTTFDPELAWMFNIGQEILCYRGVFDAVEVIRYYLEHKDKLEILAQAGRDRCIKQHTWTQRLIELTRWMGILEANDD